MALIFNAPPETTFSYHALWPKAFANHPGLTVYPINLNRHGRLMRGKAFYMSRVFRPDVVVILHSAFANGLVMPDYLVDTVADLDARKIFFLTNIYKNMPEKMSFCERIGVNVLAQLGSSEEIAEIYRRRLPGVAVVPCHAGGLDERLFNPGPSLEKRPIDIGFRGEREPYYFGHQERAAIMAAVEPPARERGLMVDFSMRPEDRFSPTEWAAFLQRCKAQLGTEAGTDFFSVEDKTRHRVNAYMAANPGASFDGVYRETMAPFRESEEVRLRLITGRVVESAACKTVLMLYEGFYEGFIRPDEHYIPIALDHSNLDDAFDKLSDPTYCARLVEASYQVVLENFRFGKLIDNVLANL